MGVDEPKPVSQDEREAQQLAKLKAIFGPEHSIKTLADLSQFPVTRKDQLLESQKVDPPFGLLRPQNFSHIFQSPGPIYEPGLRGADPWRFGRFVRAIGISETDVVQNTFCYHFTPAGAMFESAALSVGATVFPAGPGSSMQQAEVAEKIGTTAYAGTPDFLKIILEKADSEGMDLSKIKRAAVSAGPLFPQLRQAYEERGIICRQCYGTADVGLIAYETEDCVDGMFVDDDVIVEILSPGSSDPVAHGEVGEVVVTVLTPEHSIIRFSVGDLSAVLDDPREPRARIVGWRGRADQATKVRGMFIRPEQVTEMVKRHPKIERARVEVSSNDQSDRIVVLLETDETDVTLFEALVYETIKLRSDISLVPVGGLERDGVLVSDQRGN